MEILKLLVLCPFSDILSHFIAKVISFFYANIFGHLLVKYISYKYIQIFIHVEIFTNIILWSRGPLGCTTHADITLYISQISDTCISSFMPLISPKHPPNISKISPRYPQFIHLREAIN